MHIATVSLTIFLTTVMAAEVFEDMFTENSGKQVWLVNCIDGAGYRHSEMALYPGFPHEYPESTTIVESSLNTTVAWQYASITQTFPQGPIFAMSNFGNAFASGINNTVKLDQEELTCIRNAIPELYSTVDGSICSSVFQCAPASASKGHPDRAVSDPQSLLKPATSSASRISNVADATKIFFLAHDEKVVVNGKLLPGDIFWGVWAHRQANFFDGQPAGFGSDGCTVTYTGHGDIDWTTVNGLATTLLTIAGGSKFLQYTFFKRRDCDEFCGTPEGHKTCCSWVVNTYWQTHIPSHVEFQVVNQPPDGSGRNPSDQGDLSYQIQCPVHQGIGCLLCTILRDLLGLGGLTGGGDDDEVKATLGAVAKGFSTANLLVAVTCQIAGC